MNREDVVDHVKKAKTIDDAVRADFREYLASLPLSKDERGAVKSKAITLEMVDGYHFAACMLLEFLNIIERDNPPYRAIMACRELRQDAGVHDPRVVKG